MPGETAAVKVFEMFAVTCEPGWLDAATPEALEERYGAWWRAQTDPAILRLMNEAENDVLAELLGEGWRGTTTN
jgi:hypothetical protein